MSTDIPRRLLVVAAAMLAAFAACAQSAAGQQQPRAIAGAVVAVESIEPSAQIAGATGVWMRYTPTLSADCSPPRGCYAATQRIHYNLGCAPRYIVLVERISMDLNGTIIKYEARDAGTVSGREYDVVASDVLNAFCPLPERE